VDALFVNYIATKRLIAPSLGAAVAVLPCLMQPLLN